MPFDDIYKYSVGRFKDWMRVHEDDDIFDRLNRAYSILFIMVCNLIMMTYSYSKNQVECYLPTNMKEHKKYVNTYCFIANTYYLPLHDEIPQSIPTRENLEINYYQWVPFVLILQAACFFVPCMFWRSMRHHMGFDIAQLLDIANKPTVNVAVRAEEAKKIYAHLDVCLSFKHDILRTYDMIVKSFKIPILSKVNKSMMRYGSGHFLFIIYMFTKLMYIGNTFLQLFIIDRFIRSQYALFGFGVLRDLLFEKKAWKSTGIFPRVTMCDFEVRVLGNLHRHTVQCVLQKNIFNEKIYIAIWMWIFLVAILTCFSFFLWVHNLCFLQERMKFIKDYLKSAKDYSRNGPYNKGTFHKFVTRYLRSDGVFVLQLLAKNTNRPLTSEVVYGLWTLYLKSIRAYKGEQDDQDNALPEKPPLPEDTADTLPLVPCAPGTFPLRRGSVSDLFKGPGSSQNSRRPSVTSTHSSAERREEEQAVETGEYDGGSKED